ncbi:MAG: hypothetical protein ACUVUG_05895 [Candidatus Aminicenantia bacterium]
MEKLGSKQREDPAIKILHLSTDLPPIPPIIGLTRYLMSYPETPNIVDNREHKEQPVGEVLLVGVRDNSAFDWYIYGEKTPIEGDPIHFLGKTYLLPLLLLPPPQKKFHLLR